MCLFLYEGPYRNQDGTFETTQTLAAKPDIIAHIGMLANGQNCTILCRTVDYKVTADLHFFVSRPGYLVT